MKIPRVARVAASEPAIAKTSFSAGQRKINPSPRLDVAPVAEFIGRTAELAALVEALWAPASASKTPRQVVVHGMAGVGKSALAACYAWENRDRYAGAWRVAAGDRSDVIDGLAELGARLAPSQTETANRMVLVRAAFDVIAETDGKPWLLIYDDAESADALDGLLPSAGAHALIITRTREWASDAPLIPLGAFNADDAVRFLLARARRNDAGGARRLADALGRLPLTLDLAAACCANAPTSFDDFRQALSQSMSETPAGASCSAETFAAVFLAADQASKDCPKTDELLALLAFVAPHRFPLSILAPDQNDDRAHVFNEAAEALHKAALIRLEPQSEGGSLVSTNILVQDVMRGLLRETGVEARAAFRATAAVADAFPAGDNPAEERFWPICALLLPHARAVLKTAPETGEPAEKTSLLLDQVGKYHQARAEFASAEALMRRALQIDETVCGPSHPDVALRLTTLARLLTQANRVAEAEPLLRRALEIDEAAYGPDQIEIAKDLRELAHLLRADFRYVDAEPLLDRALEIEETINGPAHKRVAEILEEMGELFVLSHQFEAAEQAFRHALAINEGVHGHDHPDVAADLSRLASLFQSMGRWETETFFRRALTTNERYEPNHPRIAVDHNKLGMYLNACRDLDAAEQHLRLALRIDESVSGVNHPSVARDLVNLSQILRQARRFNEAETAMRRAVRITESALGADHPEVAGCLNGLALMLVEEQKAGVKTIGEAEPLMRRALEIDEAAFGPEHPCTARDLNNLAHVLKAGGRTEEAGPLLRRAVAIVEKRLPPYHPWARTFSSNLECLHKPEREGLLSRWFGKR
jgi:tetratricopeptide (TPR) repeat protein